MVPRIYAPVDSFVMAQVDPRLKIQSVPRNDGVYVPQSFLHIMSFIQPFDRLEQL